MEVLFVCNTNVGRSQMAEALFNRLSKKNHASSAGLNLEYREDKTLEELEAIRVINAMKEIKIDVSKNISKQLTKKMFDKADRVVAMLDPRQKLNLPTYFKNSPKVVFWDVLDMAGMSYKYHCDGRDNIKKHVAKLVKEIG